MIYVSQDGRIELHLTLRMADSVTHPGQCDADVLALSHVPEVRSQLNALLPECVRRELREYGTWSESELQDDEQNLQRLLWVAAGSIADRVRT